MDQQVDRIRLALKAVEMAEALVADLSLASESSQLWDTQRRVLQDLRGAEEGLDVLLRDQGPAG